MLEPGAIATLIAGGETVDVEFKGERAHPLSDKDLAAAAACLANRPGPAPGWLLVGVEDDGTISGARARRGSGADDAVTVQLAIANNTRPSLSCRVERVIEGGKPILLVEVRPSDIPIGTTDGRYTRRRLSGSGPECTPWFVHEMTGARSGLAQDPTFLSITGAEFDDLDPLEFDRFRSFVRRAGAQGDSRLLDLDDLELAKALGCVEANHAVRGVRLIGLLLFGRDSALRRLVPTHETAFQVFAGTMLQQNEIERWPLLRTVEELLARHRARTRSVEIIDGLVRVAIPDYPERAFREAVANALIHRDYTRLGTVSIQWRSGEIEIVSPGGFPEGVRLDNLLHVPPTPRNPWLADAFKRAGIVDRSGRGIDILFEQQIRYGRPAPDYGRTTADRVSVRLHGGAANFAFVKLVLEQERLLGGIDVEAMLILNALWDQRRLGLGDIATLTQLDQTSARRIVERLVERGLLVARGEKKGRLYLLAEAVRANPASPPPEASEALVLRLARELGVVRRVTVAEHLGITDAQATRLLARLVAAGALLRDGARGRGVSYRAAPGRPVMEPA